jgi:prophage antirepressor-like protein
MSAKDQGESDNVVGLPTEFRFDGSPVRAVMKDGDPWFVAKDVCDILELGDPSKTVERLDPDEVGTNSIRTTAGTREMLTVNESGVYSLVFTSRKPEAKRFRKWVTSEVLPEIRKTGGYRRPETQFAGLSGERVEYERWLLERALLDAKLIALGMQSIGVHYERMVTDDPEISRTTIGSSARTSIDRSNS